MDHEPNEELLSAYLDRELSPDEQAGVERWLAGSASVRDRLEELRAASRTVQGLPRTALPADFADAVIDRIRRESMLRPAPVASVGRRRHPAWWIGAPLAAAAAVLIAVYTQGLPHRNGPRLAQNNAAPEAPAAQPPEHANTPDPAPSAGDAAPKLPAPGNVVVVHDRDYIRQVEVIVIDQVEGLNAIRGICMKHGIAFEGDVPADATERSPSRKSELATFIAIEASNEQLDRLLADAGSASPIVEFTVAEAERSLLEPRKFKVASTVRDEPRSAGASTRSEVAAASTAARSPAEEATHRARAAMPAGASPELLGDLAYRIELMPIVAGQPPVPIIVPSSSQMPALAGAGKKTALDPEASPRDGASQGRAWVVQLLQEELEAASAPAETTADARRTNTLKAVEKLHQFYAEGRDVLGAASKDKKTESVGTRHKILMRLIEDPQAVRKEKRN